MSQMRLQCSMHIAHSIQRDLVDNVTIGNCQKKLVYKIKIISCIRRMYCTSKVGVVIDQMEWVGSRNRKACGVSGQV